MPNEFSFAIRLNNTSVKGEYCGVCGNPCEDRASIGPELFIDVLENNEHQSLRVCRKCGQKHVPTLKELLRLGDAAWMYQISMDDKETYDDLIRIMS
jgi:hypothetical protein